MRTVAVFMTLTCRAIRRALRLSPLKESSPGSCGGYRSDDYPVRGENPMATVHTVLKRLASRSDGSVVTEIHSGKTLYKYVAQVAADYRKGKANPQRPGRTLSATESAVDDAKK